MKVVFATTTAAVTMPDGSTRRVQHGSHWPADDPVVTQNPGLFADDPRYGLTYSGNPPPEMADPPVEQATAAPGEKRNVRRNP
jgi:hypothetical protein